MPFGTPYETRYKQTYTTLVDCCFASVPVQTQSGGTNWSPYFPENEPFTVSLGCDYSAAIKNDGTLWLWGNNCNGQLGDYLSCKSSPIQTISQGTDWNTAIFSSDGGSLHSAAIKTDGTLWLWGYNFYGFLGNNSTIDASSPIQTVSTGNNWCQVSLGRYQSAAVKTDGTLWLWGRGNCGQLGNNSTVDASSPVQTVSTGTDWKQVSLGQNHSAAIKTDGTLWLWGSGALGRLGTNSTTDSSSPVQTVSTGTNWCQVSLGCEHSVAVKTDGTLWLWGRGALGQLGTNSTTDSSSPVQTSCTGTNWKQVSVGEGNSAAIKTDGTLWLWGAGGQGRLGDNASTNRSRPVQTVATGTNWCQVSLDTFHSAAVKTDGTLWLWGNNLGGVLGNNSTINHSSPVQTVSTGNTWCQVSLGECHSAAIKTDGTLWLWGDGGFGSLGNNLSNCIFSPIQTVIVGNTWCQLDLGGSGHSAAIKTDGTLWLWGNGVNGKLGNNSSSDTDYYSPVQTVSTGTNWKQVNLGCFHSSAIKTDGTLWLWGCGVNGRLGNNDTINQSSPVQTVSTGTNWKQVNLGINHSAAIKTDGTLWLWGCGVCGKLGTNAVSSQSSPVQTVSTGTDWKQIEMGQNHSAAVKTDGTLWLWGEGLCGKLGNNSTTNRSSPVQTVATGTNWKQVDLSKDHSFAIKTDGTLWLWGEGLCGKLGTNDTINQSSPVQTVTTGTNWEKVSGGDCHSAAIKNDGTLWLWGENSKGQLGNNTIANQSSPVQTISATTTWLTLEDPAFTVSAGTNHSAAIKTDGTLWLWGVGTCGQLGTNNTINHSSPVQTVSQGTNWKQVSLRDCQSISIKTDGTLWLWGNGTCGKLGNNNTIDVSSPVQTVSTGSNWKQVSMGSRHSAAVKTDGTLWLWGFNDVGELGNNNTIDVSSPVQTVSTGSNWKQVSLGDFHSGAVKTDGTLWLWGWNCIGQLGSNSLTDRQSPVQTVSTGTNWKQVSLDVLYSAAIKTDGTLWLWGDGSLGRLGTNTSTNQSSPVQAITTGTNWKQVRLGEQHSAAIKTDGTLWLWGRNNCGQLGTNSTINQSSPVQTVTTGTNWKEVVGGNFHTLALNECNQLYAWGDNSVGQLGCNLSDGVSLNTDLGNILVDKEYLIQVYPNLVTNLKAPALWGWGCNSIGQLGSNSTIDQSSPVQTVSTGIDWQQVCLGSNSNHSAAIKTDGTLWLWGCGACGRLGNLSTTNQSSPVQTVTTGTNWKQLALSCAHSAAVKTDGTLWLWGCGLCGRLGNNATTDRSSPVQTVATGTNWKQVSLGNDHSAAIKTDGTLWLWGEAGLGELGNNATTDRSSPVQTVATGTNWKQIALGSSHSAAIKTDGTLWLWGEAGLGELGTNATTDQSSPVQTISTGTNWKSVSGGVCHTVAIKTDGTLWLWGCGLCGRLGTNSTIDVSSPVQTVSTGTNWKQISAGQDNTSAIKTDGTLWLWGCGACGRLGTNSTVTHSSPVQTITTGTNWKSVSSGSSHSFAILETYDW